MRFKKKRTGNIPKSTRKLVVGDKTYRYLIYKSGAVNVWESDGTKHSVSASDITGLTPDEIERGHRKKTSSAMIIPHHVRLYIERGFEPAEYPINVDGRF